MYLKDKDTLWGTPVTQLKQFSRRYKLIMFCVYAADILLIFLLTWLMFIKGVDYKAYGFMIVCLSLLIYMAGNTFANPDHWQAFNFYKKRANAQVQTGFYKLDTDSLYRVLYCSSYKRLKSGKTLEEYMEACLNACSENWVYSRKIMKFLEGYASEEGTEVEFVTWHGKNYFIGFKAKEVVEDGGNNAGDTENTEYDERTDADRGDSDSDDSGVVDKEQ